MLRTRVGTDAGFGLPEVIIAMGVVVAALVMLAHTVTVTLSDVGLARQRQGANAIANRTVERVRAIPQEDLRKGMLTSDLSDDPAIVLCGAEYHFRSCAGEAIVHTAGLPPTPPLVPHRSTETPTGGKTSYDVATYITLAGADPDAAPMRIIVVVGWVQPFRQGVSDSVEVETLVYEPVGCVDAATHPFAGPCRSFFFGTASEAKGSIKIEGTINGNTVSAVMETPSTRADGQLEQVDHVQGAVSAAGTSLSVPASGQGTQASGNESATSAADDDPSTASVPSWHSAPLNGSSSSTFGQGTGGVTAQVSNASGTTGATTSTTAAGGAGDCPTTTPPGTQTDDAACGQTWAQQLGSVEAKLIFDTLSSLGNVSLASIGAAPGASVAQVDREESTGDGTFAATAGRSLGELRIGAVPTGIITGLPLAWQGYYLRLSAFQDAVNATVGDSTGPPTAGVTGGTLQVWNGTGYTTVPLGGTVPVNIGTGNLSLPSLPLDTNLVDLNISASLRTGTVSVEDPQGGASGVSRTQASASSDSPVIGDINYSLVVRTVGVPPLIPSTELLNVSLKITIDLGPLFAQGNYREDPNG